MGCELTPDAVKRLRRVIVDHPERRECGRQAMAAGGVRAREARLSKHTDCVLSGAAAHCSAGGRRLSNSRRRLVLQRVLRGATACISKIGLNRIYREEQRVVVNVSFVSRSIISCARSP
jgi:hypothetical protein